MKIFFQCCCTMKYWRVFISVNCNEKTHFSVSMESGTFYDQKLMNCVSIWLLLWNVFQLINKSISIYQLVGVRSYHSLKIISLERIRNHLQRYYSNFLITIYCTIMKFNIFIIKFTSCHINLLHTNYIARKWSSSLKNYFNYLQFYTYGICTI